MTQFRLISRRNAVSGTVPSASVLVAGELAVNTADGGLYSLRTFGPLSGTVELIRASTSISSSYALSSSFAVTSSYAQTAQTVLGSVASSSYAATASVLLGSIVSASYALTASYALNGGSGGGGSALTIQDENVLVTPSASILNFRNNISASISASVINIDVPALLMTGSHAGVLLYRSASFTVSGLVALPFTTPIRDDLQYWDAGNPTRLTIPSGADGWYVMNANTGWAATTGLGRWTMLRLNGANLIAGTSVVAHADHNDPIQSVTSVFYLSASQYVEVVVQEIDTGTRTINTDARFSMVRIGGGLSASFATTSSYALQALSASWAPSTGGGSGLFASSSVSSSWASSSLSSSYALTASYALNGGGSGGNFTSYQAPIGYNVIGAGSETTVQRRVYLKAVSSSYDGMILGISAYVTNNASDNVQDYSVVVMSDNAGSAGRVLAYNRNTLQSVLLESASAAPTSRWLSVPISVAITSGTVYWIGVQNNTVTGQGEIAYDTGSDSYYTSAGDWFTDGGFYTLTSTTRNYSIFANQMYANAGTIPSASYAVTASYALNGGGGGSSDTASFADRVWAGTFVSGTGSYSDVAVSLSDARFLALTQSADLVNERVFTPSSRFTSSDAGPKQPYTLDLSDNMRTSTLGVIIDGGGLPITIGEKVDLLVPFSCSIVSWSFIADRSGSITMEIWKSTYETYPPTGSTSIVSSSRPFISTNAKNRSTGSLGWTTTAIAKNDTLRFYVSSSSTITRANLTLELIRL